MKRFIIIFTLISLYSCGTQKASVTEIANAKPIILYETTSDFVNKKPMELKVKALIESKSNKHITFTKLIDPSSGNIVKLNVYIWAVEFNGKNYFSLDFSTDLPKPNTYVKFDIEGKICAIIIDKDSPSILKENNINYGNVVADIIVSGISEKTTNWKDKNQKLKKILFINTDDILEKDINRYPNLIGDYLTRKQLKYLIKSNNITIHSDKIKDVSFEKIIEIIEIINNK